MRLATGASDHKMVTEVLSHKHCEELAALCPTGVFDVEDLGGGKRGVSAARPRDCTMCRECVRDPKWAERVRLSRKMDHFIFRCVWLQQYPSRLRWGVRSARAVGLPVSQLC